jgi:catechol 2,3-dioxygenase-like lactoylglutathione lyase family enzyme
MKVVDMEQPFTLGPVSHFALVVRDPKASARWFREALFLDELFDFEGGVAIGNKNVLIVLRKGTPDPAAFGHTAFHLPDMATLRAALEHLKKAGVKLEDPGDEIGAVGEGSKSYGLWFHDPDGYRWELFVRDAVA